MVKHKKTEHVERRTKHTKRHSKTMKKLPKTRKKLKTRKKIPKTMKKGSFPFSPKNCRKLNNSPKMCGVRRDCVYCKGNTAKKKCRSIIYRDKLGRRRNRLDGPGISTCIDPEKSPQKQDSFPSGNIERDIKLRNDGIRIWRNIGQNNNAYRKLWEEDDKANVDNKLKKKEKGYSVATSPRYSFERVPSDGDLPDSFDINDFTYISVPGDGACLFNSVVKCVYLDENPGGDISEKDLKYKSIRLRNNCVRWLTDNLNEITPMFTTYEQEITDFISYEKLPKEDASVYDYLNYMKKHSTYGGQIEIFAIANILKRNIKVLRMGPNRKKYEGAGLGLVLDKFDKDKTIYIYHNVNDFTSKVKNNSVSYHYDLLYPIKKHKILP